MTQATLQTDRIRLVPLSDKNLSTRSNSTPMLRSFGTWRVEREPPRGRATAPSAARDGRTRAGSGVLGGIRRRAVHRLDCGPARGRHRGPGDSLLAAARPGLDQRGRAGPGERNAKAGPSPADDIHDQRPVEGSPAGRPGLRSSRARAADRQDRPFALWDGPEQPSRGSCTWARAEHCYGFGFERCRRREGLRVAQ